MYDKYIYIFFFGLNCTKNISIVHVCHDCFAGCLKVLSYIITSQNSLVFPRMHAQGIYMVYFTMVLLNAPPSLI